MRCHLHANDQWFVVVDGPMPDDDPGEEFATRQVWGWSRYRDAVQMAEQAVWRKGGAQVWLLDYRLRVVWALDDSILGDPYASFSRYEIGLGEPTPA